MTSFYRRALACYDSLGTDNNIRCPQQPRQPLARRLSAVAAADFQKIRGLYSAQEPFITLHLRSAGRVLAAPRPAAAGEDDGERDGVLDSDCEASCTASLGLPAPPASAR